MSKHRYAPLLPPRAFAARMLKCAGAAAILVGISLAIGAAGYHGCADLDWIDAVHHAAMILTGMGPVTPMQTDQAKLFETFYALFSGVAFLTIAALLLGPIAHRLLHKFHLDLEESDEARPASAERVER